MIHKRLEELRNKAGLSQAEIAKRLGMPRTTYVGYENGSREPDITTINKLCDFHGVTVGYLINGKEDHYPEELTEVLKLFSTLSEKEKEAYITLWKLKKER